MRNSTEMTVNLSHLAYNLGLLKKLAPSNQILFMVKANAYGHGLLEIVQFAFEDLGINEFGCASLGEALTIRKELPKIECDLYVFSDGEIQDPEYRSAYVNYNILPVIHNLKDLKTILDDSDLNFLPLVLKFDTGMHRLGIDPADLHQVISLLKQHGRSEIQHVMTHFANSYLKLKAGDKTYRQLESYKNILHELNQSNINVIHTSCANSGAIEQNIGLEFTHIRPGLMLYGPAGTGDKQLWPSKNLSSFKTKVLKIMPIKKGTPIGYGGHVCGADGYVAYLPIGYGDGFLTYYSGADISIADANAKVLGRVNMDLTALFFKQLPTSLKTDGEIYLWNDEEQDISELSTQLKTIPYQLFTALTSRVPRRYIK